MLKHILQILHLTRIYISQLSPLTKPKFITVIRTWLLVHMVLNKGFCSERNQINIYIMRNCQMLTSSSIMPGKLKKVQYISKSWCVPCTTWTQFIQWITSIQGTQHRIGSILVFLKNIKVIKSVNLIPKHLFFLRSTSLSTSAFDTEFSRHIS